MSATDVARVNLAIYALDKAAQAVVENATTRGSFQDTPDATLTTAAEKLEAAIQELTQ